MNGTAVRSEPGQGHEERAADPEVDVGEPEGLDDEVQPGGLGRPDQAGQDDQARQGPKAHGSEDALFEAVVEIEDPVRQRQPDDDLAPEVAKRQQARRPAAPRTPTPIAKTTWTSPGSRPRKLT